MPDETLPEEHAADQGPDEIVLSEAEAEEENKYVPPTRPVDVYSGADGPWLAELREKLGVVVPDGQENAGFREHDQLAVATHQELHGHAVTGYPTVEDWQELFNDAS
jgi:hypothetical protein